MTFQRSKLKLVVVALLIALIAVIMMPALSATAGPQAQTFSATLTPVAGLVQYKASGSSDWQTLRSVQLINVGDQIRTGADGLARLNVVTGVSVEIYPTSLIQLGNLALNEDSGQVFSLFQLRGTTFASVTQTVRPTDRVQFVIPPAGVRVRGTQFYTFVGQNFDAAVLSEEDEVEVRGVRDDSFVVTPNNFLYIIVDILVANGPSVCSTQFLDDNADFRFIITPLEADGSRIEAIREYLKDLITSSVNPDLRAFVRQLIGLPSVDLDPLDAAGDQRELDEIFAGIDNLQANVVNLQAFLNAQRTFLSSYRNTLTNALAPATCGNGTRDDGETAQNCPTDFTDPAACGNGLCEIDRRGLGESIVNCPVDCLPNEALALSCAALINSILLGDDPGLPGEGPGPRPTDPPGVVPTVTPTPTPRPSGVGVG
jgi:hypothetical protein